MKIQSLLPKGIQEARDFRKTAHEEYDKNGKLKTNHYIEYTVVGQNRQWTSFMPLRDFKRLNPKVNIK